MGNVLDAWSGMEGWEDPYEVNPPPGCLVDVIMEDLVVRQARLIVTYEDGAYGYWKVEGGGTHLFEDVFAWAWYMEQREEEKDGDNT